MDFSCAIVLKEAAAKPISVQSASATRHGCESTLQCGLHGYSINRNKIMAYTNLYSVQQAEAS